MKVIAKQPGFCDNAYRVKGEVFDVEEGLFSPVWMEKMAEQAPDAPDAQKASQEAPAPEASAKKQPSKGKEAKS
jgi:hypothetical protein